ncbi:MAG TPA: hypothetical protein VK175_06255 [Leadbetterella sp.]|nr:hypothetical protein [Leadbetterella sp.]
MKRWLLLMVVAILFVGTQTTAVASVPTGQDEVKMKQAVSSDVLPAIGIDRLNMPNAKFSGLIWGDVTTTDPLANCLHSSCLAGYAFETAEPPEADLSTTLEMTLDDPIDPGRWC